jgi:non-heme chloroperoxidase
MISASSVAARKVTVRSADVRLSSLSEDLRGIAFDQRGFGDSDRPESGYAIAGMADDAVALMDALHVERASLVGHSFGSFVARKVAIAHPKRVAALV